MSNSDSSVQRQIEEVVLKKLATEKGDFEKHRRVDLGDQAEMELDGYFPSCDPPLLVEVWSRADKPLPSHYGKVIKDGLKLFLANQTLGGNCEKLLAFVHKDSAAPFREGRSNWHSACLKRLGVKVEVIDPGDDWIVKLMQAQADQKNANEGRKQRRVQP